MRGLHLWPAVGILAVVSTAGVACGPSGETGAVPPQVVEAPAPDSPVLREILAQDNDPPGAPGRLLTLVRYTIAPGAELAPHRHPGVQMASIVSGTLTYEVVSGSATVQRAVGPDGVPASVEQLRGPAETTLGPGDVVVEVGEMLHYGANRTASPVVILATLITEGTDLAVVLPANP